MHRALTLLPPSQPPRWSPYSNPPSISHTWQHAFTRLMAPLTIWICVSVSLRYGYFGDSNLVLGPSSSRLMQTNSVFVKQVQVTGDNYNNEVLLYTFDEKPELKHHVNWTASNFILVPAYSRQGFFLWLNEGSTIRMRWESQPTILTHLEGVVIKGETKFQQLKPKQTISPQTMNGKEAEYIIEEDDRYHIGIVNKNSRNIILSMNVNISAKVYDISKAKSMCSTANGLCKLSLPFPNAHYLIMTTNNGALGDWYVGVSFVARVVTYITLLGFIVAIIFCVLKYCGNCDGHPDQSTSVIAHTYQASNIANATREVSETEPMMQAKATRSYGTNREEDDVDGSDASSTSSEELYDEKLCVICYDEQRNCFFVPCGHCATCYDCAQRIVEGESKVCPICRRLIHKARRLFHS